MSDISKKVLSIDDDAENVVKDESEERKPISAIIEPATPHDPVPAFVNRPALPTIENLNTEIGKGLIWTGVIVSLLWLGMGLGYWFTLKTIEIQNATPLIWAELGLTCVVPALLIFLFFLACHKLKALSARAELISRASLALFDPDQAAAENVQSLARAVRQEITTLDNHVAKSAETFSALQKSAKQQGQALQDSAEHLTNTGQTVTATLGVQKTLLTEIVSELEARIQTLSNTLSKEKETLSVSTTDIEQNFNKAQTLMVETGSQLSDFSAQSEEKIISTAHSLSEAQAKTETVLTSLSSQSESIQTLLSRMEKQKNSLEASLNTHLTSLSDLNTQNEQANRAFADIVQKGHEAGESLKQDLVNRQASLEAERKAITASVEAGRQANATSQAEYKAELAEALAKARNSLAELETRLSKLETDTQTMEGRRLSEAETQTMPLEGLVATKQPLPGERIHLRPLTSEDYSETFEDAETIASASDVENSLGAAGDDDLAMPSAPLDGSSPEEPDLLALANEQQDLVRPIEDRRGLFGKKKKEKTGWRWRDLMGGFEGNDISADQDINLSETGSSPHQNEAHSQTSSIVSGPQIALKPFKDWLDSEGLAGDAIISETTILDVASAIVSDNDTSQEILISRLGGVADHFKALARQEPRFTQSANAFCEEFEMSLNPQIMNQQAIRAKLSSDDGKAYLLARLAR